MYYGVTLYVQKSAEDMLRNPPNGFTIVRAKGRALLPSVLHLPSSCAPQIHFSHGYAVFSRQYIMSFFLFFLFYEGGESVQKVLEYGVISANILHARAGGGGVMGSSRQSRQMDNMRKFVMLGKLPFFAHVFYCKICRMETARHGDFSFGWQIFFSAMKPPSIIQAPCWDSGCEHLY
jgi:hypothetical protein